MVIIPQEPIYLRLVTLEPRDLRNPGVIKRAAGRPHGDFELLAARVLTRSMRLPVELYDDGSQPGMPDLRIEHSDGTVSYAEVVLDADQRYVQTFAALFKRQGGGFPLEVAAPSLLRRWHIWIDATDVGALVKSLPGLLADFEARSLVTDWVQRVSDDPLLDDTTRTRLEHVGVVQWASRPLRPDEIGAMVIGQDGVAGRPDPSALVAWLEQRIAATDWSDVRRKLAKSGGRERHLIVGLTFSTEGDAFHAATAFHVPLPHQVPRLPPEVTHVWLFPAIAGGRFIAWLPEHGWADVSSGPPRTCA